METTLHHQLKEHFREPGSEIEVRVGRYRIDVVNGERLVEIQHSGLSSIRDKIGKLIQQHQVDVVKPLIARKRLIKLNRRDGDVIDQRWSPRRGSFLDLFDELLYFTRVFPHPNLRLIVPLVEVVEHRYPGHGRRRRRRNGDFEVQDRSLSGILETRQFASRQDLHRLLPKNLESPFCTRQLAERLEIQRWIAQRIAYVLRHTGSAKVVGKRGNSNLFQLAGQSRRSTKKRPAAKADKGKKRRKSDRSAA